MSIRLTRFILAVFLSVSLSHPVQAQISKLKKIAETQGASNSVPAEQPDKYRARLEQWLQEARLGVSRLDAPGAAAALPEGITPDELDARRRDLEQIVLIVSRSIKNLTTVADARKELELARTEETAWTGFKDSPPYSLLMIDELLNERDAIRAKLTSHQSSLANYERLLATTLDEAKAAEEAASGMILAVKNADSGMADAPKWRLEAASEKAKLLAARAGLMQNSCDALRDRITAASTEISLLDRKIKTASANTRFSDDDFAQIEKISAERKAAFHTEVETVSKRLKTAVASRSQAQAALEALLAGATDGKEPEGLEFAKFRVEVADGRVDSMQSLIECIESLIQLENFTLTAYQDRRAILGAPSLENRKKSLESLITTLERLRVWENVVANDITTYGADLSKLESRAASISSDDPRFSLVNDQRAARSEKLAMFERLSQTMVSQRKLIERWVADYSPKPEQAGFYERVTTVSATAWNTVKKLWNFEVMSFEDKVEVGGQIITGSIPITLGLLLRALLFFVIGYRIASFIAKRIQTSLVARGHLAEAQARTLRNWAMIVVGLFLALGTLSFLKIPLTVFAFFGGALAIGLGFGMQTLIKNFISGIIVLAERKVRVGDILDVDGIVGTVTEVNTRSSIIRGADDVETMIPNSAFLENRVTNWTLSSSKIRRFLRVGVAYGTPPEKVMDILTESAGRHGLICKTPAPFAIFEDFGDNGLIFTLYFWVDLQSGTVAMIVTSDLRLMIEKRFKEAEISVPYPQRDMRLTTDQPIQVRMTQDPDEQATVNRG